MIQFIALTSLICLVILIFGFAMKDYLFITVGGFLMGTIGVYIAMNGILLLDNFLSQAIAVVLIAVGGYMAIVSSMELLAEVG